MRGGNCAADWTARKKSDGIDRLRVGQVAGVSPGEEISSPMNGPASMRSSFITKSRYTVLASILLILVFFLLPALGVTEPTTWAGLLLMLFGTHLLIRWWVRNIRTKPVGARGDRL